MWICIIAYISIMVMVFILTRMKYHLFLHEILNNSNRRKRTKNQNFFDWLLYRPFKDVLPKKKAIYYFSNFAICTILVTLCALNSLLKLPMSFFQSMAGAYFCIYTVPFAFGMV